MRNTRQRLRVLIKVVGIIAFLSFLPVGAQAYSTGTYIYASFSNMIGNSHTILNSNETHIIFVSIDTLIFSPYDWGYSFSDGAYPGIINNASMLRWTAPEWYWAEGYHFFLEDDQNTFDDASYATLYW